MYASAEPSRTVKPQSAASRPQASPLATESTGNYLDRNDVEVEYAGRRQVALGRFSGNQDVAVNHHGFRSWPPEFRVLERPHSPERYADLTIVPGRKEIIEHIWPVEGPSRGRTHYSWSLQKAESLLKPFGQYDTKRSGGHHAIMLDAKLESLIDELPPDRICRSLTWQYFETFGTVYNILEQQSFVHDLVIAIDNPRNLPVCFLIRALIVFAIGNATLPLDTAPVSRATSLRWLELASPTTTIALETSSEFDIEAIRTWTLINLARQLISSNDLADYVSAGGAVKAAMACGLHQSAADPFSRPIGSAQHAAYDRKMLFFAAVDLDLSASITAGMVPTTDRVEHTDVTSSSIHHENTADVDTAMRETLYLSLHARYQVLKHLNEDRVLSSLTIAHLSEDLVAAMGPVTAWQTRARGKKSFARDYLVAMQQRYLFALYRPLAGEADLGSGMCATSTRITTDLARKRIEEVCTSWKRGPLQSPMAALFMGHGVTARADVLNALCFVWWDSVRHGPTSTSADEVLAVVGRDRSIQLLEAFLEISHGLFQSHADSWRLIAITEMALAHIAASSDVGHNTPEYKVLMERATERIDRVLQRQ